MPLGLFPRETADLVNSAPSDNFTTPPNQPSFTTGAATATALGIGEGAAKVAAPLTSGAQADLGGALSPDLFPPEMFFPKAQEVSDEDRQAQMRKTTNDAVQAFTPNPHTTGIAGQILHGTASALTRFAAGAEVAGPLGGAVTVGASEGYATKAQLQEAGVDENTANALGAGSALFSGAGAMLPGGFGKTLAERVLSGTAAQLTSGITNRTMMSKVLSDNGYDQMAKQYQAFDGQAMMTDAVLGAAFGGVHHVFAPSVVDAAHTSADSAHVEDSAPGVPVTPDSRSAHVDNMTAAANSLLSGEDMPELKPVETIPNPAQEAVRDENAKGIDEAASEVAGEPVAAPIEERRGDAQDLARMKELGAKGLRNLSPDETAEYADLLQKDRLSAKVAGRRLNGVQNMDAYAEVMERGELLPVQGFADMDMLKSVNDTQGHKMGDEAIRAMGETLGHYFGEGNAFHRGGDEFITQAVSTEAYAANMEAAQRYLANHKLQTFDAEGNLVSEKTGVGFSHGAGKTAELAEQAAYADKAARQRAGLRADRGTVAEKPAAGSGDTEGSETAGSEATGISDPAVQEAVDAAQRIEAPPEIKDELTRALEDLKTAQHDGDLAKVAAACFGRVG